MSKKRCPKGKPQSETEELEVVDFDPTTEIEIHVGQSPGAIQSLVDSFDSDNKTEDTIIDDVSDIRASLAKKEEKPLSTSIEPVLLDFIAEENGQPLLNYQSAAGFASGKNDPSDNCFQQYAEMMAMVRSYEKMIGDQFNLGISFHNYPDLKQIRLLSISVYRSGSVILLGMDKLNMPINIFERIENVSLALTAIKRKNLRKPRSEISFFFHDQNH